MKGIIFVVSSPTGVGKTTICEAIQKRRKDIERVVTHTTRLPRKTEKNGVDYFFVSPQEFKSKLEKNEFVEYAIVHGYYYGTSKEALTRVINRGKNPILAIDVQGARSVMSIFKRVVSIFMLPPSFEEWIYRIKKDQIRDDLKIRLETAVRELDELKNFDFCIVNDRIERSVKQLERIIDSSLLRVSFFDDKYSKIVRELKERTRKYLGVNDGNVYV